MIKLLPRFPPGAGTPELVRSTLTVLGTVVPGRPLIGPRRVMIEVSARCNFTCLMCPYFSPLSMGSERPGTMFMDAALAHGVLQSAAAVGAKIVSFSGRGEPILNPGLGDMIRLAHRLGLQSEVYTNGSLLTAERLQDLIDGGLDVLAVSVVAATAESYARAHPDVTPGMFTQVLDSLATLQRLKREKGTRRPRLDLRFIALQGSHREIDQMVSLGASLGADGIHLVPVRNRTAGEIGRLAATPLEEKIALDRLRELAPRATRSGLAIHWQELAVLHRLGPVSSTLPCYAGWLETRTLVDGTVTFCARCTRTVGDTTARPLHEIWWSSELQALRRLALDPTTRAGVGSCDCDRCCHARANWRIARLLSPFGLAPRVRAPG